MILQALTRYYEDLRAQGKIDAPGWAPAKISFALHLDENGELTQVVPTMEEVPKGKKTVLQPQSKPLPAPVKRASNIASNFLWDNSSYLLGIDQKGKPERSRECFATASKLHHAVLDSVDSPNARAILAFFDTWEPERAAEHPALIRQLDDVTAGGNLVFRVDGRKVEEDAAIREAWQRYRDGGESGVKMQCLVTGKEDEIAAVHPSVKGVRDAQSSGAALVSFNAPAFCSYGREQNYNAPVGKYAAFAYTAALNHLLADSDHVQHIGDTTVVCWAEGADDAYPGFFSAVIGGGTYGGLSDNDLRAALKRLANGLPCDDLGVDPNRPFYILGLAPNAARLSEREGLAQFAADAQTLMAQVPEDERDSFMAYRVEPKWYVAAKALPCMRFYFLQEILAQADPAVMDEIVDTFETDPPRWLVLFYNRTFSPPYDERVAQIFETEYERVDTAGQYQLLRLKE